MAEILLGNIRGKDGRGLDIKGVAENIASLPTSAEVGDVWVIPTLVEGEPDEWNIAEAYATGELYIWNGSEWKDIGIIKGEKGDKGDKGDIGYVTVNGIEADEDGDITLTADKVGAVGNGENIVVGINSDSDSTDGGVRVGIMYTEKGVPMVGMGTERGTNALILTSGCDYTNSAKQADLGALGYYFPVELDESRKSCPTALKLDNSDGKVYLLRSSNGKKYYAKNEIIPMSKYELFHTGNFSSFGIPIVETKTYKGNGLYGFENAHTFTFAFTPKMFFISGYGRNGGNYTLTVPYGFPFMHTVVHTEDGFATMNCEFRYSGNTITVYNTTSANNGFNTDGKDYTIIAIG